MEGRKKVYGKEVELSEQEGGSDQRGWQGLSSNLLTPERSLWLLLMPGQGAAAYPLRRGPLPTPQAEGLPWDEGRLGKVMSKLQKEDGA